MKSFFTYLSVFCVALTLTLTAGCQNDAGNGALIGAALGAAIGQAAGGDTEATLIGAGVGGAVGYGVGAHSDNKKQQAQTTYQAPQQVQSAQPQQTTIMVTNSNGSQTPVTLNLVNGRWVGPKGETYPTVPTEAQLKMAYGF